MDSAEEFLFKVCADLETLLNGQLSRASEYKVHLENGAALESFQKSGGPSGWPVRQVTVSGIAMYYDLVLETNKARITVPVFVSCIKDGSDSRLDTVFISIDENPLINNQRLRDANECLNGAKPLLIAIKAYAGRNGAREDARGLAMLPASYVGLN